MNLAVVWQKSVNVLSNFSYGQYLDKNVFWTLTLNVNPKHLLNISNDTETDFLLWIIDSLKLRKT